MAEYLVTVKDAACLDQFYADMQFRGYPRTIRKPLSRSTGYELTDEQVKVLKRDSRVLEIELRHPPGVVNKPLGSVNYEPYSILGDFSKLSTTSSNQSDERQWGHIHHAGSTTQRRYGDTPGTVNSTSWNTGTVNDRVDIFNNGKHVDVVIFDQPVSYDHADWISDETGLTRFVQYDWFAMHNSEVIGGLDDDGLASPGSNYTYGTAQQHGSTAYHGTHVCGTVAGRHFGWAKEANIYSINVLSPSAVQTYLTTELAFDYVRAFHRNKPINPMTGFKNPTIINCSYGSGYDLEETYPSGVQASDIYGIYYKGRLYDDGITPYDGNTGSTTPVGMRGVMSNWSIGEITRLFGARGFEFPYYSTSNGADVEDAIADGIVVVKAAGNDDSPRSGDHHKKTASTLVSNDSNMRDNLMWLNNGWTLYYTREANPYAPGIITVGALTPAVNYNSGNPDPPYGSIPVSFSNRGIDTHVWAAGVYIASVYPPNTSGGYQDIKPGYTPGIDYFRAISGTSMDSPQVAGVLACYASGRERFNSADAHRYLQKTSNTTEMFTDNWAKNYPATVRKSLPIDVQANGTDIIVSGQDRARDMVAQITDNTIRLECLDTLNFTFPQATDHMWRIVKGSSTGLVGSNIIIDDPAQYQHQVVAVEAGGLINWTPGIDDVGFYWLVCGCSLLPNHDNRPNAHTNNHEILIIVDPPGCWDDTMSAGGSSKRLLQVSNTRPATGLMSEWCHEKGNRWGLGHAGLELDHRGNRKNRAILGSGEKLWPRQNTLNNSINGYLPAGDSVFATAGTHSWTCPTGVTSVCVVAVGGGGAGGPDGSSNTGGAAGGGGLGWKNNISVTPGQSYTVVVGAAGVGGTRDDGDDSYFINNSTVAGLGGKGTDMTSGQGLGEYGGYGGSFIGDGGGNGGRGGEANVGAYEGGGGGAGGYSGNGGNGGGGTGYQTPTEGNPGQDGSGGGGGGGQYGGGFVGGGTDLYGIGPNGTGGNLTSGVRGSDISRTVNPFPGGGGSGAGATGGSGAVRIIWGPNKSFPSNAVIDV
jgi:hypothetical protein